MNFPAFDNAQKISESGVTNVALIVSDEAVNYPKHNMSKMSSTVAETEQSVVESSQLKKIEPKAKNGGKSTKGDGSKKGRDMDRAYQQNNSCK